MVPVESSWGLDSHSLVVCDFERPLVSLLAIVYLPSVCSAPPVAVASAAFQSTVAGEQKEESGEQKENLLFFLRFCIFLE